MPGLRFFVCDRCHTVYAAVESHRQCRHCTATPVEEISGGRQAAEYFAPSDGRG